MYKKYWNKIFYVELGVIDGIIYDIKNVKRLTYYVPDFQAHCIT